MMWLADWIWSCPDVLRHAMFFLRFSLQTLTPPVSLSTQ